MLNRNRVKDIVQTHNHTDASLLDGLSKVKDLVAKAKNLGHKAIAITDHGSLGNTYSFYKECKANDIKPLLGIELYYTPDTNILSLPVKERDELAKQAAIEAGVQIPEKAKKKDIAELIAPYTYSTKGYHILFIAKNQIGWTNLMKLSGEASDKCTYNGRPHCDLNMIKKYSEGLICTTACLAAYSNQAILNNEIDKAEKYINTLHDIFKDDFYLEIQPFVNKEQVIVNQQLIDFAYEKNIHLINGTDSHYIDKEDHEIHDILLCIGTGSKQKDEVRFRFENQFWFMSLEDTLNQYDIQIETYEKEIANLNKYQEGIYDSIINTNYLAETVSNDIKISSDKPIMPKVEVPSPYKDDNAYLKAQCWDKLYKYLRSNNLMHKRTIYEERLKHELNVICKKGFASYFLIVQDFILWGNNNGCPFGPGRGSAAGSLVAFLLGIVDGTDPIEYDLLFFRFLTMDRSGLPDIDSDVDKLNRQRCIDYMEHKYGITNTSQVGTWTIMGVKNSLLDVARVLDIPYNESLQISKSFDDIEYECWQDIDELDKEEREKIDLLEKKYPDVFRIARKLEGVKRNYGVHAGGIIITPDPVNNFFPTRTSKDGRKVSVWDKNEVEEAGLCKLDLLGLATVSIINLCLGFIEKTTGVKITMKELYNNKELREDPNVLEMIRREQTESVFQFESNLFKSIIKGMKPDSFEDCIALTSIARPGPLGAGLDKAYNEGKHGTALECPLGSFDYLNKTYNCIIYQEQPMMLAKDVAGFNDNQADSYLRKGMAKGKKKLIDLCREWFIYGKPEADEHGDAIKGGIANGYDEQVLADYFDKLMGDAKYLFNKSHATSYSLNSLITAWLKYYYPVEFYASVLSIQESMDKCVNYMSIIREEFGIETIHPDINLSGEFFTPDPSNNVILFGLNSVKGVGEAALKNILANQPFNSLEDFLNRCDTKSVNKKVIEALIKAGAMDCFNPNRYELLNQYYEIRKVKNVEMFNSKDYNSSIIIEMEEQTLGIPLTAKPWFDKQELDTTVRFECIINKVTEKYDRNGNLMAFVKVVIDQDKTPIEVVLFSSTYSKCVQHIEEGNHVRIQGKKTEKAKVIGNKIDVRVH